MVTRHCFLIDAALTKRIEYISKLYNKPNEDRHMKLNIKWFSITALIVGTVPLFILFVWCAANGFGIDLVRIFESIHPSGGLSIFQNMEKTFYSRIPGILIDSAYAAADCFIVGFAFSALYNLFISRLDRHSSNK
jgi:hypothetical protein